MKKSKKKETITVDLEQIGMLAEGHAKNNIKELGFLIIHEAEKLFDKRVDEEDTGCFSPLSLFSAALKHLESEQKIHAHSSSCKHTTVQ